MSRRRRGVTLAEVLVVCALVGVVAVALQALLLGTQRFARAQPQILDVQRNIRAVAQLLPAELRGLDAGDGDLVAMSDTAITIKAQRAVGVVCGEPDASGGRVTLAGGLWFALRALDPARDSLLLLHEGDTLQGGDDRWLRSRVAVVGAAACPDGAPGIRVGLSLPGGPSELEGVTDGAPVQALELVRYRLYEDGSRKWWLGVQTFNGAWSATSPLAGPLRPRDGLRFAFLDAAGAPTTDPTAVGQVLISIRGLSVRALATAGRSPGPYQDSATVRVLLRNNVLR